MNKSKWIKNASILTVLLLSATSAVAGYASVAQLLQNMQNEVSAVAVLTKQTAVAANQISDSAINSQKTLADATGALMSSARVRDVVLNYDPTLGQPMLIKCDAQYERQLLVELANQAAKISTAYVGNYSNASVASRVQSQRNTLAQHRELFCTVSEAQQGMCTLAPNGMQGWDSNYAGPFGQETLTPDGELAAYNFITNVVDTRQPDAGVSCKSQACASARLMNMQTTAVGSMVAQGFLDQVSDRRSTQLEP